MGLLSQLWRPSLEAFGLTTGSSVVHDRVVARTRSVAALADVAQW